MLLLAYAIRILDLARKIVPTQSQCPKSECFAWHFPSTNTDPRKNQCVLFVAAPPLRKAFSTVGGKQVSRYKRSVFGLAQFYPKRDQLTRTYPVLNQP